MVDTALLGHLDNPEYLSGVAVGSAIVTLILWAFGFLRMGTTGLTARAFGEQNNTQLIEALNKGVVLASGLGLCIILLSLSLTPTVVAAMGAQSNTAVFAEEYTQIRLISAPFALLNYVTIGWLIGLGNSRWPLVMALVTNTLNILLDVLFIFHLDMGASGAAMATACADIAGSVVGAIAIKSVMQKKAIHWSASLNKELRWAPFFTQNSYLFVRTLLLLTCLTFFTSQGARLGDNVLSANTVLYQWVVLSAFALDAFAHATESFSGRYFGAQNKAAFVAHTGSAFKWAALSALFISSSYAIAGDKLIQLLTDNPAVTQVANEYLLFVILMPIISMPSYQLDGLFIGTGELKAMRDIMIISAALFLIVWLSTKSLGNAGLWWAFLTLNLSRGVGMSSIWWIKRKQWFS